MHVNLFFNKRIDRVVKSFVVLTVLCLSLFEPVYTQQTVGTEYSNTEAPATLSSAVGLKPRWEVGLGGGFFSGFDYPASSVKNERSLVVPFFIYRSPILRVGDGGFRAVAIERPRLKLDLSIGGSLNASSEDNSVREGMPDLDFLFEIGPKLEYKLFDRTLVSGSRVLGRFTSDLRAVFSTDFSSVNGQGFIADAGLGLNVANVAGSGITFITSLEVSIANERLQDYFYEVQPQFVTGSRAEFDASGGYLETTLVTGLVVQPFSNVRVFASVINGFFDGARNQNSPLFEVTQQTSFALGVVWSIKKSRQSVELVDLGSDN